jgi:hypothetical protein
MLQLLNIGDSSERQVRKGSLLSRCLYLLARQHGSPYRDRLLLVEKPDQQCKENTLFPARLKRPMKRFSQQSFIIGHGVYSQ